MYTGRNLQLSKRRKSHEENNQGENMCQGVIVSLVKFKVKGKRKSVILSGIGSHSQLIADNKARLRRAGWKEGKGESVISIESDFRRDWGKCNIVAGQPTSMDSQRLKKAYLSVAGSAPKLIAHTKRCGKIDDALVALLRQSARAEYEKVEQSARAEYEKVTQPAWAEYDKVTQPARAEYDKVTQSARAEYKKVEQSARAEYDKVTQPAWAKLFSDPNNRVGHLR